MPAASPIPGPCQCGKVVFDLSERRTGDKLHCPWCGQDYRYLGGDQIAPLSLTDSQPVIIPVKRQEAKPEPKRVIKLEVKRDVSSSPTPRPARSRLQNKKQDGPPGGLMPMIGFIVSFNVLAFSAIWFLLPKQEDGLRHAIWDSQFTVSAKALWPDLSALVLGHILGFACWALFAYRVHQRDRLDRNS